MVAVDGFNRLILALLPPWKLMIQCADKTDMVILWKLIELYTVMICALGMHVIISKNLKIMRENKNKIMV